MAQVLTYCTAKLLARAILPFAVIKPKPVEGANDDDPLAVFPCVWR